MDESKPPILLSKFRSRSASQRTCVANGPLVTVYYRNEEEVHEGFLIALRAMGVVADVERQPEPAMPPVSGAKP